AALGHHLDEVTGAELECQVPPHAQDNYLLVEMPTPEEFLCGGRFCHPSRYRRKPSLSSLRQNRSEEGSIRRLSVMTWLRRRVFVTEAGLSEDFVQSQPLPDLVADMDCSSLPSLFDFHLL